MYLTYKNESLEEANSTLNHILDVIIEGTWDWNANTGRVDRSPGWYRMLGYQVGVFKKDVFTWENIIHPDDYDRVMKHFELYLEGEIENYRIEYRARQVDGKYLWIVDRGKVVLRNSDGSVARMIGAHQNIHDQKMAQSELIKQNQMLQEGHLTLERIIEEKTRELELKNAELEEKVREVEYISNTDSLTSIANRKKFEEELKKEAARANRYSHPLSLSIFDLDFFKNINDTHGHKTGDLVLQKISRLVLNHIRKVDFFARWGGEEFTIIFPDLDLENTILVAEKLRTLISQYEIEPDLFVTCSFGVSEYVEDELVEEMFQRADRALYRAKELGRNRVESMVGAL
jgi:diguanylate cyclase (GGDEF)-like protein/PAS domain S-box-containing protein